jgi:hypothetical protein
MANPGTINASNFFGGDKVEQYRQELVADGRIPGTKQNATPEERKEGLKLYRKNKIEFKTFVENVLKKKSAGEEVVFVLLEHYYLEQELVRL